MAKKCARTFSIVVEKGKKSILDVGHLLPVGIARSVRAAARKSGRAIDRDSEKLEVGPHEVPRRQMTRSGLR